MEKNIENILNKLLKRLKTQEVQILKIKTDSAAEAQVVVDFEKEIKKHLELLDILKKESNDEEYIKENKVVIKKYLFEVNDFLNSIPTY